MTYYFDIPDLETARAFWRGDYDGCPHCNRVGVLRAVHQRSEQLGNPNDFLLEPEEEDPFLFTKSVAPQGNPALWTTNNCEDAFRWLVKDCEVSPGSSRWYFTDGVVGPIFSRDVFAGYWWHRDRLNVPTKQHLKEKNTDLRNEDGADASKVPEAPKGCSVAAWNTYQEACQLKPDFHSKHGGVSDAARAVAKKRGHPTEFQGERRAIYRVIVAMKRQLRKK